MAQESCECQVTIKYYMLYIGWLPRQPLDVYLVVLVMAVKMSQLKRAAKKQQMR